MGGRRDVVWRVKAIRGEGGDTSAAKTATNRRQPLLDNNVYPFPRAAHRCSKD